MKAALPVLFLIAAGCGASADSPPPDSDDGPPADTGSGTATTGEDTDPTTGEDTASPDSVYEVGWNLQGKTAAEYFVPLAQGADCPVVKGPQGAWMLVVAGRTNRLPEGTKYVRIEMSVGPPGEDLYAKSILPKRPVFSHGGGLLAAMNNYMIVHNNEEWDGQNADLSLVMEDLETGERFEELLNIRLYKDLDLSYQPGDPPTP